MPEWVTVARTYELSDGQMASANVDGIELLVANVGGEYRSIGDECTHAECSLAEGEIDDGTVICPCHGSVFDLRSGAVLEPPATEREPVYQARIEGDEIRVAKPGT